MTNKDKFIEVFGFEPDTETMIPVCPPRGVECPFMDDGIYSECHCELWWGREYKPESGGRRMTRERIEDMREVVLPFVKKRLLETNYEGLGKADAKEFEREFNEILNLATKALEQEPRKGYWLHRPHVYGVTYCSICDFELKIDNTNYCPHCGAKMESEKA